MKGKYKNLLSQISIVIPLLIIGAYSSSVDALAPILRNMAKAFPDASLTLVQMTLTLPSAVSIPVQLFTVLIAQHITKKQMMVIAILFICFGGLIPLVFHGSIMSIVISSVFIGIGQGFFMPAAGAIVGELFDGNMRGTVMGLRTGVAAFLRSGLTLLVGFLGAVYWYRAYLIFVIMIPIIIYFILVTPNGPKGEKLIGKGVGLSGLKAILTPGFVILTLICTCATFSQMAYLTNIAGYIADKNLGGAVTAGVATSFNVMARFIIGLALGFLLRVFKKHTLGIGYAMCAIGYAILLMAGGMTGIQVGGIIYGFGLGIQMAAGMYYITEVVAKEYLSHTFGLYMPFISFAVSIAPVVINSLSKTIFGATTATNNFKIGLYGYIFTTVAMFVYQFIVLKDSKIGLYSGLETAGEEKK